MNGVDECSEIGRLAKRETAEKVMYGFIKGALKALPGISVEVAIGLFIDDFKLNIDKFNPDSAKVVFHRMNKQDLHSNESKEFEI